MRAKRPFASRTSPATTSSVAHRSRERAVRVRKGEIFGLTGCPATANGELAETIAGLTPKQFGHRVSRGSAPCSRTACPEDAIRTGLAYVPEDRLGPDSVPELSISDNLVSTERVEPSLQSIRYGQPQGYQGTGNEADLETSVIVRPTADPCRPVVWWQHAERVLWRGS